jgi:hypothetical protein
VRNVLVATAAAAMARKGLAPVRTKGYRTTPTEGGGRRGGPKGQPKIATGGLGEMNASGTQLLPEKAVCTVGTGRGIRLTTLVKSHIR